jgi:hypothetical protein
MYKKSGQVSTYEWEIQIDWLSFTAPLPDRKRNITLGAEIDLATRIFDKYPMLDYLRGNYRHHNGAEGLILAKARFPYKNSLKNTDNSLRLFFDRDHDHVLAEISGQGCQQLYREGNLNFLLRLAEQRLTRIDLAYDVRCDHDPETVYKEIPDTKFRSSGSQISDTGKTVYVGSRKSQRYARIYRYAFPHPRHDLLRFEMVFRKEQAKYVGGSVLQQGLEATIRSAGAVFGFDNCEVWQLESAKGITAYRPERGRAKSERWFYSQVVPAIRRMISEGILTESEVYDAIAKRG